MATNIRNIATSGDFLIQIGNGVPTHEAPKGSKYTDLDTGKTYENLAGATVWGESGMSNYEEHFDVFNAASAGFGS